MKTKRGPRMKPCGTPQEIFPKPDSLFSVSTKNIPSQRWDLNHWILYCVNLIALRFCNETLWFIVSNAFWRLVSIIPVSKPSSNHFNILSVKCANHGFVEWFGLNPDWKLYKILFCEKNLFAWSWPSGKN